MSKNWVAVVLTLVPGLLAAAEPACESRKLGTGVSISESTSVASVLDRPDDFLGKAVRVEGEVVDVCAAAGCWMELRAGEGERSVRVKVEDGEIVFPVAARGRRATAEGTVEAIEMMRQRYLDYRHHIADETGVEFDPATVEGEGPFRVIQIRGRGAEVCL